MIPNRSSMASSWSCGNFGAPYAIRSTCSRSAGDGSSFVRIAIIAPM